MNVGRERDARIRNASDCIANHSSYSQLSVVLFLIVVHAKGGGCKKMVWGKPSDGSSVSVARSQEFVVQLSYAHLLLRFVDIGLFAVTICRIHKGL